MNKWSSSHFPGELGSWQASSSEYAVVEHMETRSADDSVALFLKQLRTEGHRNTAFLKLLKLADRTFEYFLPSLWKIQFACSEFPVCYTFSCVHAMLPAVLVCMCEPLRSC